MSKMKEVAALLGVEIGEEFQLADNDGVYASVYRITEREVEYFNESINKWITYDLGINFVSDKRVIKKPWKPKKAVERVSADECIKVLEAAIGEAEYVIPGNVITSAIYYIGEYQRLKIDESWDRCPERMGR